MSVDLYCPAGLVRIAAATPGVGVGSLLSVPVAGLALAAKAPAVTTATVAPPVAAVTLAAAAPVIDALTLAGAEGAPGDPAALTLTGAAPAISPVTVAVPAATISLSTRCALVSVSSVVVPAATLNVAGVAPVVDGVAEWSAMGLPCPRVDGYGYSWDPGLVRTPFAFGAPRQSVLYTQRPRTFTAACNLDAAQLAVAEDWLDRYGFDWFRLRLVSADSGGPGATRHRVRLTDGWAVRRVGRDRFDLSFTAEQAAADETCALVENAATFTACLDTLVWTPGGAWPTTLGLDWCATAAAWGEDSDWGRPN